MSGRTHIVGAGLAGLSAAVHQIKAGRDVSLHEGAGHAGGRCRSYRDAALGRQIDNGNHLLLSANRSALAYLKDIGAGDSLSGPGKAEFPFLDLESGERWTVGLGPGFLPRAILSKSSRVPGSRAFDYLKSLKLLWAGENATVAQCLGTDNALFRRFWEPMTLAILNTSAEEGAASLLKATVRETLLKGEAACRPLIAKEGLSESFVDPALRFLIERGAGVGFNRLLKEFQIEDTKVTGLNFGGELLTLNPDDTVILAVPSIAAAGLVPGLEAPTISRAIVNGHFLLEREAGALDFLGLVGGTAQWLFVRGSVVSVTVSAADALADEDTPVIAERLWADVATALGLGGSPMPAHRIVKERRATFAQTPEQVKRRHRPETHLENLFLAGDWTDTGLPATIEGTIRSGVKASETVLLSGY
ncbi:MAG: FAD-dependent oxidoreductase [Rhodospirillales bacterium]|nr:FAD-dependent oxidoreductase [Rhodospirillales bacterium]